MLLMYPEDSSCKCMGYNGESPLTVAGITIYLLILRINEQRRLKPASPHHGQCNLGTPILLGLLRISDMLRILKEFRIVRSASALDGTHSPLESMGEVKSFENN